MVHQDVRPTRARTAGRPPAPLRRRIAGAGLLSVAIAAASIALQGLVAGNGGAGASMGAASPIGARFWVVRPGDTLWSIAAQSDAAGDPRPVVDWLSAEVRGRPLQVGQRILLPPPSIR